MYLSGVGVQKNLISYDGNIMANQPTPPNVPPSKIRV